MNKRDLQRFRKLLIEQRDQIQGNAKKALSGDIHVDPDDFPDEMDIASSEVNLQFAGRLREREQGLLAKIDAALKKLKFNRRLAFAPPLAGLLVPFVESELSTCDVLVPVPLNRWRQARRGFNQADELCRTVARQTGLPVFKGAQRRRMTASQSGLSATARVRNVRDAFTVRALPPYRHPLIVDDVVTTGATCDELAKALKSAGAKTVSVIAVARASGN